MNSLTVTSRGYILLENLPHETPTSAPQTVTTEQFYGTSC
jgi:hypothetical protein